MRCQKQSVWLSILLTPVLLVLSSQASTASSRCEVVSVPTEKGLNRVDLRDGDRTLSVIGWRHHATDAKILIQVDESLRRAAIESDAGQCDESGQTLEKIWQQQAVHYEYGQKLLNEILRIDQRTPLEVFAVESTKNIFYQQLSSGSHQLSQLQLIAQKCPRLKEIALEKVAMIAPGPEYLFFIQKQSHLRVVPVEDESAIKRTIELNDQLNALPEYSKEKINPAVQSYISTVLAKKIEQGLAISDSEIDHLVALQGAGEESIVVKQSLHILKEIIEQVPARNQKMVENLGSASGRIVYPVGSAHVADLAKKLYNQCLHRERQSLNETLRVER